MIFKKQHPPVGASPGTLMISEDARPPVIRVMKYGASELEEVEVADVSTLSGHLSDNTVTWVDVQGLGDEAKLRAIGECFHLHSLAMEDVANVPQTPKTEAYEEHQFFVTRMAVPHDHQLDIEQVSLFAGTNYVLSFQERHGDVLDRVRQRIRRGKGPMRAHGADYLAYAIIDAVVDGYYPVVDALGDRLEELEEQALAGSNPRFLEDIMEVKRQVLALRRAVWPQREAIREVIDEDTPKISDQVCVYLRDVHDHCIQLVDFLDTYRELISGVMDVYLSMQGHRQNEVMKVLTVMASIFIPLTFLAGVYGMNFEHMPELKPVWSYPVLLILMALIAIGMVIFFRRKGWFDGGATHDDTDR